MATQDAAKSFAWFEIPVSVSSEALSARRNWPESASDGQKSSNKRFQKLITQAFF
jgi:hypothetical protein